MRLATSCLAGTCLAVVISVAPLAAQAQDATEAKAFVAKLYAAYHGRGPDYLGRDAKATFAPSLLKLFQRVTAATPKGDVGALDGDPICDCQDFRISKVQTEIAGGTGGKALATVHFRNSGTPQKVRLDLVAVEGHWRVSDVHTRDTPSLVAYLTASLGKSH